MNALRKILLPLLLIPLGMFIYVCLRPDWQLENPALETIFLLIGVPIVTINFFAWFYPDVIQAYFPVKEHWGTGRNGSVAAAIAISALTAFACVGIGTVAITASASPRPTFVPSPVQPATATAFARSLRLLASATDLGIRAVASTPRESPQVEITPDQTEQIPVSGEGATRSPMPSLVETKKVASVSSTSTESVSAKAAVSTPARTTGMPPSITTATRSSGSCTPASPVYMDAIREAVQEQDAESNVITGWMSPSKAAEDLWFVAAKVQGDTAITSPAVWGVFVDAEGNTELYAINDVAMELSYTYWGEDSEPVLTMQSDGAQVVYNCAVQAR